MKKIIISMLAAAALIGCSKNEGNGPVGGDDDSRVAIRLSAGVAASAEIQSKAVVDAGATVQIEGWEGTAANYTGASTWQSTADVTTTATATKITLLPLQYYNADDAKKTFIKGWYPQVASSNGTVTFTNTDGTKDVLYATEVSGSKYTPISAPLQFEHKSTQLIFRVKKGTGLATGTEIKSIKLNGAEVPTSITLADDQVTYTPVASLAVPNITQETIPDEGKEVGEPLMIKPVDNNATITLDIETVVNGNPVTYTTQAFTTTDSKLAEGKAYTITLTFTQNEVTLNAAITPWDATGEGSGNIL